MGSAAKVYCDRLESGDCDDTDRCRADGCRWMQSLGTQALEPPYCQVVGRNAVVLLTPEQIAWIIREASSYPVKNDMAMDVLAEMRRAELALKRASTRVEAEQNVEAD